MVRGVRAARAAAALLAAAHRHIDHAIIVVLVLRYARLLPGSLGAIGEAVLTMLVMARGASWAARRWQRHAARGTLPESSADTLAGPAAVRRQRGDEQTAPDASG